MHSDFELKHFATERIQGGYVPAVHANWHVPEGMKTSCPSGNGLLKIVSKQRNLNSAFMPVDNETIINQVASQPAANGKRTNGSPSESYTSFQSYGSPDSIIRSTYLKTSGSKYISSGTSSVSTSSAYNSSVGETNNVSIQAEVHTNHAYQAAHNESVTLSSVIDAVDSLHPSKKSTSKKRRQTQNRPNKIQCGWAYLPELSSIPWNWSSLLVTLKNSPQSETASRFSLATLDALSSVLKSPFTRIILEANRLQQHTTGHHYSAADHVIQACRLLLPSALFRSTCQLYRGCLHSLQNTPTSDLLSKVPMCDTLRLWGFDVISVYQWLNRNELKVAHNFDFEAALALTCALQSVTVRITETLARISPKGIPHVSDIIPAESLDKLATYDLQLWALVSPLKHLVSVGSNRTTGDSHQTVEIDRHLALLSPEVTEAIKQVNDQLQALPNPAASDTSSCMSQGSKDDYMGYLLDLCHYVREYFNGSDNRESRAAKTTIQLSDVCYVADLVLPNSSLFSTGMPQQTSKYPSNDTTGHLSSGLHRATDSEMLHFYCEQCCQLLQRADMFLTSPMARASITGDIMLMKQCLSQLASTCPKAEIRLQCQTDHIYSQIDDDFLRKENRFIERKQTNSHSNASLLYSCLCESERLVLSTAMTLASESHSYDVCILFSMIGCPWTSRTWISCLGDAYQQRDLPSVVCLLNYFVSKEGLTLELDSKLISTLLSLLKHKKRPELALATARCVSKLYGSHPLLPLKSQTPAIQAPLDFGNVLNRLEEISGSQQAKNAIQQFCDTGTLCLQSTNPAELLQLALRLNLPSAHSQCEQCLVKRVYPSNCVKYLKFAQRHELPQLEKFCLNFLAKNMEPVVKCDMEALHKLLFVKGAKYGVIDRLTSVLIEKNAHKVNYTNSAHNTFGVQLPCYASNVSKPQLELQQQRQGGLNSGAAARVDVQRQMSALSILV